MPAGRCAWRNRLTSARSGADRRRRRVRRQTRRSLIHTTLALVAGAGLLGTRYRRLGGSCSGCSPRSSSWGPFRARQGCRLCRPQRRRAARRPARRRRPDRRRRPGLDLLDRPHPPGAAPDRVDGSNPWGLRLFTAFICLLVGSRHSRWCATRSSSATSSAPSSRARPSAASARRLCRPRRPSPRLRPVGGRGPRQPAAAGFGRRQRPRGHAYRLDGRGEHQPQTGDAVLISIPRSLERARSPAATGCTSCTPTATTAPAPLRRRVPHQRRLVGRRGEQGAVQERPQPRSDDYPRRHRRGHRAARGLLHRDRPRRVPEDRRRHGRRDGRHYRAAADRGVPHQQRRGRPHRGLHRDRPPDPRWVPRPLVCAFPAAVRRLLADAPAAVPHRCGARSGQPGQHAAPVPAAGPGRKREHADIPVAQLPAWVNLCCGSRRARSHR